MVRPLFVSMGIPVVLVDFLASISAVPSKRRKAFSMRWRAWLLAAISLGAQPAFAQTMGVDVQVSNGYPVPTQQQLQTVLRPGDFVRDVLGWQKADPHCDLLTAATRGVQLPVPMATLYQNVAAAQGRNFVTLAFNNTACGQASISGAVAFPDTPALRAEFAAYAAGVVRLMPALGGISIWNELDGTWNGGIADQATRLQNYCLLTNAVITEVRKVDKNIPIAIGATIGWGIDRWFMTMFDQYGCMGKGDPTIWLDVHPYLTGQTAVGMGRTDTQLWHLAIANMRADQITNPLIATEWGAKAAYTWLAKNPGGDYMNMFQTQILAQDGKWAGATWYEMLYDARSPNASLFDFNGNLTLLGSHYISDFHN
jgi:hypothetical protein